MELADLFHVLGIRDGHLLPHQFVELGRTDKFLGNHNFSILLGLDPLLKNVVLLSILPPQAETWPPVPESRVAVFGVRLLVLGSEDGAFQLRVAPEHRLMYICSRSCFA